MNLQLMSSVFLVIWSLTAAFQPPNNPNWVAQEPSTVTVFSEAESYGITGLLAHDYLAGQLFYDISIGDRLEYHGTQYTVVSKELYLRCGEDLCNGQGAFAEDYIFNRYYREGAGKLVLQTCYNDKDGFLLLEALPIGSSTTGAWEALTLLQEEYTEDIPPICRDNCLLYIPMVYKQATPSIPPIRLRSDITMQ